MRSDSATGFVNQFSVYTGKQGNTAEVGLGGNVVQKLVDDIKGTFRCVYMDNFFSGVPLYLDLLENNIYACGTIRSNRKCFPQDLKPTLQSGLSN